VTPKINSQQQNEDQGNEKLEQGNEKPEQGHEQPQCDEKS